MEQLIKATGGMNDTGKSRRAGARHPPFQTDGRIHQKVGDKHQPYLVRPAKHDITIAGKLNATGRQNKLYNAAKTS